MTQDRGDNFFFYNIMLYVNNDETKFPIFFSYLSPYSNYFEQYTSLFDKFCRFFHCTEEYYDNSTFNNYKYTNIYIIYEHSVHDEQAHHRKGETREQMLTLM